MCHDVEIFPVCAATALNPGALQIFSLLVKSIILTAHNYPNIIYLLTSNEQIHVHIHKISGIGYI